MKTETAQFRGYSFEKEFGKVLGIEPTRGSGNQWYSRMDLRGSQVVISCKHTDAQSFRVTKSHLREIQSACEGGEEPVLAIDVDGEVYIVQRAGDWIASRTAPAEVSFIQPSKSDTKRATAKIPILLRTQPDGA